MMKTTNSRANLKIWFYTAGSLSLGLILIAMLSEWDDFRLKDMLSALAQTRPIFGGLIIATTLFHFWITAKKWQLVTEQIVKDVSLRGGFFYYTALSGLLSQVLPQQISVVTVRTLALHRHEAVSLGNGASSTLFDQGFDFLIPAGLIVPCLLVLLGKLSPCVGMIIAVAILFAVGAAIILFARRIMGVGIRIGGLISRIGRGLTSNTDYPRGIKQLSLLCRPVLTKIYVLSVLRCLNLMLRASLVVPAAGLNIPLATVVYAFPLVFLSGVINVTPANIGIAEWGWFGLLKLSGFPSAMAIKYAFVNRCFTLLAIILVNLVLFTCLLTVQYWRCSRRGLRSN